MAATEAWKCDAETHAGEARLDCVVGPNCDVQQVLSGCEKLVPCTGLESEVELTSAFQGCDIDVSGCDSLFPGDECQLKCLQPTYFGPQVDAICPRGNTKPGRPISLPNGLPECFKRCPDPDPLPEGYTGSLGYYRCAAGWTGTVSRKCVVHPNCTQVVTFGGCQQLIDCTPIDPDRTRCELHAPACSDLSPGESCDLSCRAPYRPFSVQGFSRWTAYCPPKNIEQDIHPVMYPDVKCNISCGTIPAGYQKLVSGWTCAAGFAGTPQTSCDVCGMDLKFSGCRPLMDCMPLIVPDACMYKPINCDYIGPGTSCEVQCGDIYRGESVTAKCPEGNVEWSQPLIWTPPECTLFCPIPRPLPPGYYRTEDTPWECAYGYTGDVHVNCSRIPGCDTNLTLTGCIKLETCRRPQVRPHWFDYTDCESVLPGTPCTISCKPPFVGEATTIECPAGNTDPTTDYVGALPSCKLPCDVVPPGYMKLPTGWHCAPGYGGNATKSCVNVTRCEQDMNFSGCFPIQDCRPPAGVDLCVHAVDDCSPRVGLNESCEVQCRAPFTGPPTTLDCPEDNYDEESGLLGSLPTCSVECADPVPAPEGYELPGSGGIWQCDPLHRGTAVKTCTWQPYPDCTVNPGILSGCTRIRDCAPFQPEEHGCRYAAPLCEAVLEPGQTCQLQCQAALVGTPSTAECPADNVMNLGPLVLDEPLCDCPLPQPTPDGYERTSNGWQCADGYNGTVAAHCRFGCADMQQCSGCSAELLLSGCEPIVPCLGLMHTIQAGCLFNLTACTSVEAGASCEVTCLYPYIGDPGNASCLENNTDAARALDALLPHCRPHCVDETFLFEGYVFEPGHVDLNGTNNSSDASLTPSGSAAWSCDIGYVGTVQRDCYVDAENCTAVLNVTGCLPQQACSPPELDSCQYDASSCNNSGAGTTCMISCLPPYVGAAVVATCPFNNTVHLATVLYEAPVCNLSCDAPPDGFAGLEPILEGLNMSSFDQRIYEYSRCPENSTDFCEELWQCRENYTGAPQPNCTMDENCSRTLQMTGCSLMHPCLWTNRSQIDECRFNTSACTSTDQGFSCYIPCQAPYVSGGAWASCPVANTDPFREMEWEEPDCGCPDPFPFPAGYIKNAAGEWACGTGFLDMGLSATCVWNCTDEPLDLSCNATENGSACECCRAELKLEGCLPYAPCVPSVMEACGDPDLSLCRSVDPGSTCRIPCKHPFVTAQEGFGYCPTGNIEAGEPLQVTLPLCRLGCEDPELGGQAVWLAGQGYAKASTTIGQLYAGDDEAWVRTVLAFRALAGESELIVQSTEGFRQDTIVALGLDEVMISRVTRTGIGRPLLKLATELRYDHDPGDQVTMLLDDVWEAKDWYCAIGFNGAVYKVCSIIPDSHDPCTNAAGEMEFCCASAVTPTGCTKLQGCRLPDHRVVDTCKFDTTDCVASETTTTAPSLTGPRTEFDAIIQPENSTADFDGLLLVYQDSAEINSIMFQQTFGDLSGLPSWLLVTMRSTMYRCTVDYEFGAGTTLEYDDLVLVFATVHALPSSSVAVTVSAEVLVNVVLATADAWVARQLVDNALDTRRIGQELAAVIGGSPADPLLRSWPSIQITVRTELSSPDSRAVNPPEDSAIGPFYSNLAGVSVIGKVTNVWASTATVGFGENQMAPGSSCDLKCRTPFYKATGNIGGASCPTSNTLPDTMPLVGMPECELDCPELSYKEGYTKVNGTWQCEEGWIGDPRVSCWVASFYRYDTQQMECSMQVDLVGCGKLQPCALPVYDECKFDLSDCASVMANTSCEVRCKPPYISSASAVQFVDGRPAPLEDENATRGQGHCPDGNVNPRQPLQIEFPDCQLVCEDPPESHAYWERYEPVVNSTLWQCAKFHAGEVEQECRIRDDCSTIPRLSGCLPEQACVMTDVRDEYCKMDVSQCVFLWPGDECSVTCIPPCQGLPTRAYCPAGNTNPYQNLLVGAASCAFDCDPLPPGYAKYETGWQCAPGYAGRVVDGCVEGMVCEQELTLSGCEPTAGCAPPVADDCMFDVSDCSDLAAGDYCEVKCKWPYRGTVTKAQCHPENTVEGTPAVWLEQSQAACYVAVCPDAEEDPKGYMKIPGRDPAVFDIWRGPRDYHLETGYQCAPGFTTGNELNPKIERVCTMLPGCQAVGMLTNCKVAVPCVGVRPRDLYWWEGIDFCKYDIDNCSGTVASGEYCEIPCRFPYDGQPTLAHCQEGNLNPYERVLWEPANCTLQCPLPPPEGIQEGYEWKPNCSGDDNSAQRSSPFAFILDATSTTTTAPDGSSDANASNSSSSSRRLASAEGLSNNSSNGTEDTCPGTWFCAENFSGAPDVSCHIDGKMDGSVCNKVMTYLGCNRTFRCMPPAIDPCIFDVSACEPFILPGESCTVTCKYPAVGGVSIATCPEDAFWPDMPAVVERPQCSIEQACSRVHPTPMTYGYVVDSFDNYICNKEHNHAGTVKKWCEVADDCSIIPYVSGCHPIVPCKTPDARSVDACKYELAGVARVEAGSWGLIGCVWPHTGTPSNATCMVDNTDPYRDLTYVMPDCQMACPDPTNIPPGYVRDQSSPTGFSCLESWGRIPGAGNEGYGGRAVNHCEITSVFREQEPDRPGGLAGQTECTVSPMLVGCEPTTHCAPLQATGRNRCRILVEECEHLAPGIFCTVKCRPPYYVGPDVLARCPYNNTDSRQQPVWHFGEEPQCEEFCPDPDPLPAGYLKDENGFRCAPGYIGNASAVCAFTEECWGEYALSGCFKLVPCPTPPADDPCMVNMSDCGDALPGGESCTIRCQFPYVGASVTGTCPFENIDPDLLVNFTSPVCTLTCPDPDPPPPGYRLDDEGVWECASGFTGMPTAIKTCVIDETCQESTVLSNCGQLMHCAPLVVEGCQYDAQGCDNLYAGESCDITCKHPAVAAPTRATCPSDNIYSSTLPSYTLPECQVEDCDDSIPPGYKMTYDGWRCADGYAGTVKQSCGTNHDCEPEILVEGCAKLQPCVDLHYHQDACLYDTTDCANMQPGDKCVVSCRAPYSGASTIAECLANNTNASATAIWTPPVCGIVDCPDPAEVPVGFVKDSYGAWRCEPGFAGSATKECDIDQETCTVKNGTLWGCVGFVPCIGPVWLDKCQYDVSSCDGAANGGSCELRCKAPYVGAPVRAVCPEDNINRFGFVQFGGPPSCTLNCPDPEPGPGEEAVVLQGYRRRQDGGWECDEGWAGQVLKLCELDESCNTNVSLTGCAPQAPCKIPDYVDCQFDVSDCQNVPAGGSCKIRCQAPFEPTSSQQTETVAVCPATNTDSSTELTWPPLKCSCSDPEDVPLGYMKYDTMWTCDAGFVGNAMKHCRRGDRCLEEPVLEGCEITRPCAGRPFEDIDVREGYFGGTVTFGPSFRCGEINEYGIMDYWLYQANVKGERLGEHFARVPRSEFGKGNANNDQWFGCCPDDFYSLEIEDIEMEPNVTQILVVARTRFGPNNFGLGLPLVDRKTVTEPKKALDAAARRNVEVGRLLLLLLAALGSSLGSAIFV
eukprot:TRINITY_DN38177_c0_g1_i1.p1 TRINITY_DN38177_c0_g1~~TRINITY_DN38177_c0_g1_i1.p1  ORF type:complete len:3802 (+),score=435.99 TRINITY_DN38177_c0_g1_i1:883-11406(+)